MMTVVDQVRPWLMPSRRFANSTQFQLGAHISRNGTGTATSHPATSTCLRPTAVRQAAGAVVGERLRDAEHDDEGQHGGARGELELLLRDRRQDAALHADHGADERVDDDQQRELPEVLAQAEAHAGS